MVAGVHLWLVVHFKLGVRQVGEVVLAGEIIMEAVIYFVPLLFLFTAITSSIQGYKLVLLWVLLFIGWAIGLPTFAILTS